MQMQISLGLIQNEKTNSFWSRKERRKWFLSLLCGTCLIYATRTSVPLLMPIISREKQWSKPDSGIILSSFFWGYTLTQVASGYISDKIGGQKVLLISALGWSMTTFFMPEVIEFFSKNDNSVLLVATIRTINGAFQGMHFPSMISLISQRLHETERASFFSLLTSGSALGTLLTGSLGSYLLENYNWIIVFQTLGGLSLAWTLLLSYHTLPFKEKAASTKSPTTYTLPWLKLLKKPPFWSCVIGHACQNNCFFVLLSWMPMYFHDTFPEVKGWVVNMVPWLTMLPCTFLGKALSEKIIKTGYSVTVTRKIIETICFLIEVISLLFLAKVETFQSAIICLAFIIGGSGFHNNAIAVNPSDLAPKHSGSVFGLMNTVGAIPGFLGVYFSGYILHVTHSWSVVFIFIAIIDVLGCIIYLLFGSGQAII
ncbi:voltage-gated purine nucleotide uniporter SLC17A9 isoform X2 [Apis cerana]|uniref:Solute carrier family n=1 Tax=Apis cerana cerana TaxID=94128 RepID=A0A2A3E7E1_APICC|nr:voltage-gated purine nucleotide uniporter SLC17A9 isoform X2 [Apis cerana]XP_061929120.1 voltage-gated purine nucleotide uniporter SLC17A9 isoform X2 [Apis cerana]PBC27683.1 Solute carrier family [Apis cerana cerana]